jgi:Ca-activated chloride channel family protein
VVVGLCWAADSGARPEAAVPETGGFTLRAEVDRVILPITVFDAKGALVPGLVRKDFAVFEDGRPQHIRSFSYSDIPLTVGLVVDDSTSMAAKRATAILAALHFLRLSNPEDELFVVNFNERVHFGLPDSAPFSSDPSALREALLKFPSEGRTALYDAIEAGLYRLTTGTREKKALLVVSDGADNASHYTFHQLLEQVRRSEAIIYTIGVFEPGDSDENPHVLKKLAHATGGEAFFPSSPAELPAICRHIATILRSQYTIGYAPANDKHDGAYRRIRVVATAPGSNQRLVVRTRAGYYAPLDGPARVAR